MAMTNAEDLDGQHILFNARELKDGIWLERILSQIRRSMCGMGVDTFQDLPDKVHFDTQNKENTI